MPRRPVSRRLDRRLQKVLADLAASSAQAYQARLQRDLLGALKLHHWLDQNPVSLQPSLTWNEPVYRVTYGNYNPLSVAGSLSDGGRFNVGGAQELSQRLIPNLRKAGCLYAASTAQCALFEAADPVGNYRMFRLTLKRVVSLWDLKVVLATMNYPSLTARINATPMSQRWILQKSPLESQILAQHLRDIGGQGLVYDSLKNPGGKVLAFFLEDDHEAYESFEVVAEPTLGANQI